MAEYDLSRLSPGERNQLLSLLVKSIPSTGSQASTIEMRPIAGAQDDPQEEEIRRPGNPPPDPERAFGQAPKPNPPQVQRLPSAQQWVRKQIGNLSAVGEANYREGITRPKKDPIQAGIAAQDRFEAQMRKPEVLARRVTALRKTNMDEWASMAERVGAGRLVSGVTERQFKVERFVETYQPKLESHLRTVDALPGVTDADRERRMLENLRGLKRLKGA